jgi:hypothetical protein
MKGLLLKDLLFVKNNAKTYILMIIVYGAFAFYTDGTTLVYMIPFVSLMLCINSFSYDEYNKWDAYAISLPIKKCDIVKSKYVFTIILTFIGALLSFLIILLTSIVDKDINYINLLVETLGVFLGMSLYTILMYPLIYKFGIEKGRIFIIVLLGAFVGCAFGLSGVISENKELIKFLYDYGIYILSVIVLILLFISYKVSTLIYSKKEF